MNISIISFYSFPFGMAATNRIKSYAKGMKSIGATINIVLPKPTDSYSVYNRLPDQGEFEGIKYHYLSGRYKSKYKILRGLSSFSGIRLLRGCFKLGIYFLIGSTKQDVIIISTDHIPTLFFTFIFFKIIKQKAVFIFDEYPIPIRHKLKNKIPKYKILLYRFILRFSAGYISISSSLAKFYNNIVPKPTFVMPVIVDTSRFDHINKIKLDRDYLCYMGNMELSKDNVDLIIRAFSQIYKKYPDLDLYLYGKPMKEDELKLKKLISQNKLCGRVFLKGYASNHNVPLILKNAKILVSSQPSTRRAEGGFPTKLAEYLLSEVPTLLSDVGENSLYVENDVHAYFAIPDSVENYSEKLDYILEHYDEALSIAKKGKELILKKYSHIINGKKLVNFLRNL